MDCSFTEIFENPLQAFAMDGEMHVLHSFTPVQAAQVNIDYREFLKEAQKLDESIQQALAL